MSVFTCFHDRGRYNIKSHHIFFYKHVLAFLYLVSDLVVFKF